MLSGVKVMCKYYFFILLFFLFTSCDFSSKKKKDESFNKNISCYLLNLKYAKGFKVKIFEGFKHLSILNPTDTSKVDYEFILLGKGGRLPKIYKGIPVINIPVKKTVCLTLTQLSYLIKLDVVDNICGINDSKYLFNEEVKKKVKEGDIKIVGRKGNFKTEIVMAEDPDLIFVSPFKEGGLR